jgi:hypothetical protein
LQDLTAITTDESGGLIETEARLRMLYSELSAEKKRRMAVLDALQPQGNQGTGKIAGVGLCGS